MVVLGGVMSEVPLYEALLRLWGWFGGHEAHATITRISEVVRLDEGSCPARVLHP